MAVRSDPRREPSSELTAAERGVVAALLTSAGAFDDVVEELAPDDFHHPALAATYAAVLNCEASGRPVDAVTVADEMRRAGNLSKIKGLDGLRDLADGAGQVDNLVAYVEMVANASRRRRLADAGRGIVAEAVDASVPVGTALENAEASIFQVGANRNRSSMSSMAQVMSVVAQDLAKSRNQLLIGHSTGFKDLDKITAGLQGGQLVILAARPAMGKSALALQMAMHVAQATGLTVPFISYEMSNHELGLRLLSNVLRFNMAHIRSGVDLPDGMDRKIGVAMEKLAGLDNLKINDTPPPTIAGLRSLLRREARRGPLGLVVVDYLQLLESDRQRGSNRNDEVSDVTRSSKRLATELDTPVLALSQLSRALETRPNKRPQLSDLRDSGSIEQDANTVMFLYRDSYYNAAADPNLAELIVAKQRSGSTGVVNLVFQGSCTRFDDLAGPQHGADPAAAHYTPGGRAGRGYGSPSPF